MARLADRIVTLSELLGEMLLLNGVPKDKLTICRTGISDSFPRAATKLKKEKNEPLHVVFLGRWNRTKGIHLLVEAVKYLPDALPIKLTIYGSAVDDERYRQEILTLFQSPPSKRRMTVSVSRRSTVFSTRKGFAIIVPILNFVMTFPGTPPTFCGDVQPSFSSSQVVLIFPFALRLKFADMMDFNLIRCSTKFTFLG